MSLTTTEINVSTNAAAGAVIGEKLAEQRANLQAQIRHADEGGRPFLVKADGTIVTIEKYLSRPVSRRGEVQLHDSSSFGAYVNRFREPSTVIFADQLSLSFIAVLDYHEEGAEGRASWGRHRAVLKLQTTEPWQEWTGKNKQAMTQTDFANWIEERIPDIAEPAGADIVTMARTLEARKNVAWKSHVRAKDGSHDFSFTDDTNAQSGSMTIPDEFTLVLEPFMGAEKYAVQARFRYRLQGSSLSLFYELVRIREVIDKAFADEREDIQAIVKDVPVFAAPAPEMAKAE